MNAKLSKQNAVFLAVIKTKIGFITMVIMMLTIFNSTFCQTQTPPSGVPSKDEIFELLSEFDVLFIDDGYLLNFDDQYFSKAQFSLKYSRLIVKCKSGFETYIDLGSYIKYSRKYSPTILKTRSGRAEVQKTISIFQPSYMSEEAPLKKGVLWFVDVTIEDTLRIEKALNFLKNYYITKDPFK
jgi:hypothetical protein